MNRVIRNPQVEEAVAYFGGREPRFVDDDITALMERARLEGYEQGRRDGAADGRAEIAQFAQRFEVALRTASAEMQAAHQAAVETTIDTALAVAEFVLGRLPGDGGDVLIERIQAALDSLDDQEIVVRVSRTDHAAVVDAVDVPPGVTIEPDQHLQSGEASLRGRWSVIDMTRRAALEVVKEALA